MGGGRKNNTEHPLHTPSAKKCLPLFLVKTGSVLTDCCHDVFHFNLRAGDEGWKTRERERERGGGGGGLGGGGSNSKTLFSKDCSLGSFRAV